MVCVCLGVYVCACMILYMCVCVCVHACVRACVHACMRACVHMCVFVCERDRERCRSCCFTFCYLNCLYLYYYYCCFLLLVSQYGWSLDLNSVRLAELYFYVHTTNISLLLLLFIKHAARWQHLPI